MQYSIKGLIFHVNRIFYLGYAQGQYLSKWFVYLVIKQAAKEILIKERDEEIAKLRSENGILMENGNRMKRIAWKMDQEIKALRATQN